MRIERQELYCHGCGKYVQFSVDLDMDGNHVFKCPNCEHEHCRVVKDGKITGVRWDRRNVPTIQVVTYTITVTNTSTWDTSGTGNMWLKQSWQDSTGTATYGTNSYTNTTAVWA